MLTNLKFFILEVFTRKRLTALSFKCQINLTTKVGKLAETHFINCQSQTSENWEHR